MDVSIIIINSNSALPVRQSLRSLFRNIRSASCEVLVVDEGSFDGCGEMLQSEFPTVGFVQCEPNTGFARACNLGAARTSGRYLWFLSPETELIEDSLRVLLAAIRNLPGAAAVGCRLLNHDRTMQTTAVRSFPTLLNQVFESEFLRERFPDWSMWGIRALYGTWPKPTEVEIVSEAAFLISRIAFDTVGGFTESYDTHGAQMDLCFKLQREGGRLYYVPDTSIIHFGGETLQKHPSESVSIQRRQSTYQFMALNRGYGVAQAYRVSTFAGAVTRLILIGPLMLFGRSIVRHGGGSWRKWSSLLRWSLGFHSLSSATPTVRQRPSPIPGDRRTTTTR